MDWNVQVILPSGQMKTVQVFDYNHPEEAKAAACSITGAKRAIYASCFERANHQHEYEQEEPPPQYTREYYYSPSSSKDDDYSFDLSDFNIHTLDAFLFILFIFALFKNPIGSIICLLIYLYFRNRPIF